MPNVECDGEGLTLEDQILEDTLSTDEIPIEPTNQPDKGRTDA